MAAPESQGPGVRTTPPVWAEHALRLLLKTDDRDSVSGDLLEEYRESVHAGRERLAADRWYVRQVVGFMWRATWFWGVLLALLTIGRVVFDWFDPPSSFYTRSLVSTCSHAAVFVSVGFSAVWRGRSLLGAAAVGLAAQTLGAAMIFAATILLLGVWQDPQTSIAIAQSGGIGELFTLPIAVMGPAVLLSTLGGAAASVFRRPV
jgi:hypothetical protein